jgi:tRNA nucleotidyltransferase/poly(A) polymerase
MAQQREMGGPLSLSGEGPISKKREFELSSEERQLFEFLLEAVESWVADGHPEDEGFQLRVAGGWVRDKLLGKPAQDIDIALERGVSPILFAQHVEGQMQKKGFVAHSVASIAIRPELFKHLETATAKLFDFHVDFCDLRSDEYTSHPSTPSEGEAAPAGDGNSSGGGGDESEVGDMAKKKRRKVGTAEEDALQRDLTVNTLFYNLKSELIEDYTRRGLEDLREGLLRAPLEPQTKTLRDDPLRALRAIRLSGKLIGFRLSEELVEAFSDPWVLDSLKHKISRERIGKELQTILDGPAPWEALRLLFSSSLFSSIFHLPIPITTIAAPAVVPAVIPNEQIFQVVLDPKWSESLVFSLKTVVDELPPTWKFSGEELRMLMITILLLPLAGQTFRDAKRKEHLVTTEMVSQMLKWRQKEAEEVQSVHQHYRHWESVLVFEEQHSTNEEGGSRRKRVAAKLGDSKSVGLLLRKIGTGSGGVTSLYVRSLLCFLVERDLLSSSSASSSSSSSSSSPKNVVELFLSIDSQLDARHLKNAAALKPLLNVSYSLSILFLFAFVFLFLLTLSQQQGEEVKKVLGLLKAGPMIGKVLQGLIEWQFENPLATVADAKEWLTSNCTLYLPSS